MLELCIRIPNSIAYGQIFITLKGHAVFSDSYFKPYTNEVIINVFEHCINVLLLLILHS